MALATSTSSVSSMVYEAKASTSGGVIPASSRAARIARHARAFSVSGSCFAKVVWPMPTMAVASLSTEPPDRAPVLTARQVTTNLTDSQLLEVGYARRPGVGHD